MRLAPLWLPAILSLLAAALMTSSGEGSPRPDAEGRSAIVAVDIHPAALEIDRPHSSLQLLLTGTTADGSTVDVTRAAELLETSPLVEITPRGVVRPRKNGEGVLRFAIDGVELDVPVRVSGQERELVPSYLQDVMPIVSRAGCNAGGCHGAQDGKNGFMLSLRGYDPVTDHAALTDDLAARRFDRVRPEESLFLLKPTASIPHEGGRVVEPGSDDYEVLLKWVADGVRLDADAPRVESIDLLPKDPTIPLAGDAQQMKVLATYTDGTVRDVSAHAFVETSDIEVTSVDGDGLVTALRRGEASILARYEGRYAATRLLVMGERDGFVWEDASENNYVDELVHEKLQRIRVQPSGTSTDAEFLRRLRLDLTGRLPDVKETRTFLMDSRDSKVKRDEQIDRLIGSPDFVEHWTNRWSDLLQVNSRYLGKEGAEVFREWIRGRIASNEPYDEFAHALLTATGSTYENPPASWHKVLREPDGAMETMTQLFLGVRFNCNKCHDHPFERWTQDQHWEMAAYFARVDRQGVGEGAKIPGEERIVEKPDGELTFPDSGRTVAPAFPFDLVSAPPEGANRREQLAWWTVSPENPYFATSFVNRIWSYLLGVGLIEPVDDLRASNPPSNPALLERLTNEFVESGFDVRGLIRTICRSQAYQRSIATNEWNEGDSINYAHAVARRLPAEVLYDAVHQASGATSRLPGVRPGTRATELVDGTADAKDGFLGLFGRPPRESACECERSDSVSLGQALNLVNGPTIADAIGAKKSAIVDLVADEPDAGEVIEELYLRFLSRMPSDEERSQLAQALAPGDVENAAALGPEDFAELTRRQAEWEAKQLPISQWAGLVAGDTSRSLGGATLIREEGGVIRVEGTNPDKDTLTVVAVSDLPTITGLRLEVLPHDSLPARGPGRAQNGNFVLNELTLTAVPLLQPEAAKAVTFKQATADFSQQGWPVAHAIDGKPDTGWAVSPQFGRPHVAVFETTEDLSAEGGFLLVAKLAQDHGSKHTIGRFRLTATGSPRPVRHSTLPEDVLAALQVEGAARTPEQTARLHAHFVPTQPDLVEKIRLEAARDVAWALANSPAFLFNR